MFIVTKEASKYINSFLNSNQKLKIQIIKGGCSGYKYKFECIDGEIFSSDFEYFKIDNIEFYIEKTGLIYIAGAVLSYKKTQTGYLLYFENPQLSFCGCGKSFK